MGEMVWFCTECLDSFTEERSLARHINTKHKMKVFKCEQCDFTNLRSDVMKRHVDSKHSGITHTCTKCGFTCDRKDNLNRHIKSKHPQETRQEAPVLTEEPAAKRTKVNPPTKNNPTNTNENERSSFQKRGQDCPNQGFSPLKIYQCGHCSFQSYRAYNAKRHAEKKHPGVSVEIIKPTPPLKKYQCGF